ncbi:hypothetical protein AMTRI_Chr09g12270 [Amborella trichopoda]
MGWAHLLLNLTLVLWLLCLVHYAEATRGRGKPITMNAIDRCWRSDRNWAKNRMRLAACSVGFTGKMWGNVKPRVRHYVVTSNVDDPVNPGPGTLRDAATRRRGRAWITFSHSMTITLKMPLLVSSFTTIDGRGADVQIAYGSCLTLSEVNNVIIHGLRIHHCVKTRPGPILGSRGQVIGRYERIDGDAIAVVASSKIWIDHNTLSRCQDGLLDVTRESTAITVSNNWFRDHEKVMLLGHDDGFAGDRNMRVTIAFNHFGPNCDQRMPRIRHGYAHLVNNFYDGWTQYAIGGSGNPTIKSEGNFFVAPANSPSKAVIWQAYGGGSKWNWKSRMDVFQNGAYFTQAGNGRVRPRYTKEQFFAAQGGRRVRALTRSSGALRCVQGRRC